MIENAVELILIAFIDAFYLIVYILFAILLFSCIIISIMLIYKELPENYKLLNKKDDNK